MRSATFLETYREEEKGERQLSTEAEYKRKLQLLEGSCMLMLESQVAI